MDEKIKTRAIYHWIDENNILNVAFDENAELDEQDIIESTKTRNKLFNGNMHTVLVDHRNITSISRKAQDLIGKNDELSLKITSAMAIVVQSHAQRIMGNFFMNFTKPPFPTKLFSDKKSAVQWLLDHLLAENKSANLSENRNL